MALLQMAESARLSDLQRETIIKLRDLYLRNVGILARRRKQLTATLQVLLHRMFMMFHLGVLVASLLCACAQVQRSCTSATAALADEALLQYVSCCDIAECAADEQRLW